MQTIQLEPVDIRQLDELEFVRAPKARCADGNGTLTHLFFSEELIDIARAKAICGKCRLRDSCLEDALERSEPWGVWGGQLVENGRVIADKRPRGRPPKHPRPQVDIDEVPVPPHLIPPHLVA
jgi:WhiB family redox-sensing transcriptional regulator